MDDIFPLRILIDPPASDINLVLFPKFTSSIRFKVEHVKTFALPRDPYDRIPHDLFLKKNSIHSLALHEKGIAKESGTKEREEQFFHIHFSVLAKFPASV